MCTGIASSSECHVSSVKRKFSMSFQRCQDAIRISAQLIVIYLLLDPSSNHKLLLLGAQVAPAGAVSAEAASCGLGRESKLVRLGEHEIERSERARALEPPEGAPAPVGHARRAKRSAAPVAARRDELAIWDQIELLLRAYQEQQQQEQQEQQEQQHQQHQQQHHQRQRHGSTSAADQRLAPADANDNYHQRAGGRANEHPSGRPARPAAVPGWPPARPGHETRVQPTPPSGDLGPPPGTPSEPSPLGKVIETAVFIDQALDNKFAGLSNGLVELNKLVLTIMNQVQYLFEYSSLQVAIRLKLVLVEHLRESERLVGLAAPSPERGDIDAYLSNFCNWQQSRLEREKRLWWDHAILLSGLDLYKATPGKNHSGVLGLAWVGGMCKGNYSCTINEASNFESAFVIAHEIGHSLGIMHDGQKNKCDANSFIMSERTGAGKVHWSRCSNGYLNDSIARGQLRCLDSEQNNQIDSLYDLTKLRSPGQVYTVNEQCKLAFGANYSSFITQQAPFNAVCRELWCVSGTWAKAAHPALEGSSCAGGQQELVCREGKCARPALN